jgi:glycosyltransferase involved in cell wall biosynthesis
MLPVMRRLLPDHTLAYAQRHFDYPTATSFYNDCDILITQTPGQTRHAFNRMTRLNPFVVTIPNGVELDHFRPPDGPHEKAHIRADIGIPAEAFVAMFPCKVAMHKGSRYLLRWVEQTQDRLRGIHFLVTGDLHKLPPSHSQEMRRALTECPGVTWIRGVARSVMPTYYKAADVCLAPALLREGFSMAAIEAMAAGLPLIASASGCYLELIKDGHNGLLCRQEFLYEEGIAALQRLRDNPSLCQTISRNARDYAERKLSREKVLRNFSHLLGNRFDLIDSDMSVD